VEKVKFEKTRGKQSVTEKRKVEIFHTVFIAATFEHGILAAG
jgi:hypothetical protein